MIHLNITGDFAYNEDLLNNVELAHKIGGTSVNILTFFIIYKFSTPDMKDYKIHLMLYQLSSSSLDFLIGVMSSPILFLPILCGTGQGLLHTVFGIGPYELFIIIFTFMCADIHFMALGPIFYRWQQVLPENSWMKAKGPISRFIYEYGYLFIATPPCPVFYLLAADDINIVKHEFRLKYPNDAHLADIEGFYWFNVEKHPTFIFGLLFQFFWMMYDMVMIALCNVSMIRTLNDLRVHMSTATRKMHLRFLRTIALQTAVPTIWLLVPMVYLLAVIFKEIRFYRIQDVTNLAIVLASSHGSVVSIYLLSTNPAYREVLYSVIILPIRKLLGYWEPTPVSVAPSSLAPNSTANVVVVS